MRTEPTVGELGEGEQLLLWALRRRAAGQDMPGPGSVETVFCALCGQTGGRKADAALRCMLVLVALYGRRKLTLGPPGWSCVTADERHLLQLFAAAQSDRFQLVALRLEWLLRPGAAARPEQIVSEVADALLAAGLPLPLRAAVAPPPRPLPRSAGPVAGLARRDG